jgi:hypothetical protein
VASERGSIVEKGMSDCLAPSGPEKLDVFSMTSELDLSVPGPQLITYKDICDKALDMLIEKVGELPVKPQVYHSPSNKTLKTGSVLLYSESEKTVMLSRPEACDLLPDAMQVVLANPMQALSDPVLFNDTDLRMPLEEFMPLFCERYIERIAQCIEQDFSRFRTVAIFGNQCIPKGVRAAEFSERDGFWLRFVQVYEVVVDKLLARFDVLYGGI